MNQYKNLLDEVFYKMPNVFTSNQFNKSARKRGLPQSVIDSGRTTEFLHMNAKNERRGSKTWCKNAHIDFNKPPEQEIESVKTLKEIIEGQRRFIEFLQIQLYKKI